MLGWYGGTAVEAMWLGVPAICRIAEEQVAAEGKPEAIRPKIVEGKLRKFIAERTLTGQPFVRDENRTVAELVQAAGKELGGPVTVKGFARFKVGEA